MRPTRHPDSAEHVIDERTLDLLRDYGVDFAQGYAIAEPLPIGHRDTPAEQPEHGSLLGRAAG